MHTSMTQYIPAFIYMAKLMTGPTLSSILEVFLSEEREEAHASEQSGGPFENPSWISRYHIAVEYLGGGGVLNWALMVPGGIILFSWEALFCLVFQTSVITFGLWFLLVWQEFDICALALRKLYIFTFKLNGICTKLSSILNQMEFHLVQNWNCKLSPRSYPIQCERKRKYIFLSVRGIRILKCYKQKYIFLYLRFTFFYHWRNWQIVTTDVTSMEAQMA